MTDQGGEPRITVSYSHLEQDNVPDYDGERTLLFDLDMAIHRLHQDVPDHPSAVQLTNVSHNLLRRWAEM